MAGVVVVVVVVVMVVKMVVEVVIVGMVVVSKIAVVVDSLFSAEEVLDSPEFSGRGRQRREY